ncbi:MAG TPA: hypothetical protein EYP32_01005 [Aquificaceae bacterium]|nr:hypothetical protein [Aquificaceae bacterium]
MPRPVSHLFLNKSREKLTTLEETLKELLKTLKEVCRIHKIEDLSTLKYETIALAHTQIRKTTSQGIKSYRRVQLKAYLHKEGKQKTKTLASWKEEETPAEIYRLVNLYRACKNLSRACDYLYGV